MPNEHRPLKVFLSYASQDRPVVRELSRRLVGEGWIDTWLDEKKLLPGQDWRTKIEEAVETSDVVIICLSSNSVGKEGFVQKELRYAREIAFEKPDETIFLIPLRLDDCIVPRGLRFYQWGDYFGEKSEETYAALLEVLKIRYGQKLKLEEEERAFREALETASRERAEREIAERIARQKAEWEAAEKTKREKTEWAAAEKAAREKAKLEVVEKNRHERNKRRAAQITAMKEALSKFFSSFKLAIPKAMPFLRIAGMIGVICLFLWGGLWAVPKLIPPSDATSTTTVTPTPTITPIPSNTSTITPTLTNTLTPTPSEPFPYIIQEGDSLESISERFNLGLDGPLLIYYENLSDMEKNGGVIFVGQTITIPLPGSVLPTTTPISPDLPRGTLIEYRVIAGDTLAGIATRFNSLPDSIMQENGIADASALQAGQILQIPVNLVTTSTQTPTALPTIIYTTVPISMTQNRNGLEFTFQIQNIPTECDLVACELRWMVWEGNWIGGNPNNGAQNFSTLRYDSGWKKADDKGLTFVISIPNSMPGKPYHITFKICTDSSRSKCQTTAGQYSNW